MAAPLADVVATVESALGGTDNDKKIAALTVFKSAVASTADDAAAKASVPEIAATVSPLLKSAMKSSNGHLSFAALSCLPPYFTSLAPAPDGAPAAADPASRQQLSALRSSITALVPATISALGDPKERTRDMAKQALLDAAKSAAGHGSGQQGNANEALVELEGLVKGQAFANKAARCREQICLYYATVRQSHPGSFPLKPYLPSLVTLLEDSDPNVRSASLESIVSIFADPSVSGTARVDLKKEMGKQGTRKAVADQILAKVFGGDVSESSKPADSEATDPNAPPLASTSTAGIATGDDEEVPPVFVGSARDLETELSKMIPSFEGKETEHNWQARESSILILRGMLRSGVGSHFPADLVAGLRGQVLDGVLKALASLRTTLAVSTCAFVTSLGPALGTALDPLVEALLPALLKMASFTKKIVASASQVAAASIVSNTSFSLRTLTMLTTTLGEKTVQARTAGVGHLKVFVEHHGNSPHARASVENGEGWPLLESALKKGLADANPGVKDGSRKLFWSCATVWPGPSQKLLGALDATTKRQLEKAKPQDVPAAVASPLAASTRAAAAAAPPKRTSVRLMIQASRAANAQRPTTSKTGTAGPATRSVSASGYEASSTPASRQAGTARAAVASPSLSKSVPASAGRPLSMVGPSRTPRATGPSRLFSPPTEAATPRQQHALRPNGSNGTALHPPEGTASPQSSDSLTLLSDGVGSSRKGAAPGTVTLDEPIVEEALRSNALQAVSAAERLLELVDPDDAAGPPAPLGPGGVLLPNANATPLSQAKRTVSPALRNGHLTHATTWQDTFKDSPAHASSTTVAAPVPSTSKDASWYHRHAEMVLGGPLTLSDDEIRSLVEQVVGEKPDPTLYKRLARASAGRPSSDVDEASSTVNEAFWADGGLFDRLFAGLAEHVRADQKVSPAPTASDSQLLLLRSLVLHQSPLFMHKEAALYSLLLDLRARGSKNVTAAAEAIAILAADLGDPLLGIGALRSVLEEILKAYDPKDGETARAYSLALKCLGHNLARLPAAVLEDEVVRVRDFIMRALNNSHQADLRLAAVSCLVSVHGGLRDQQQLFALVGTLSPSQEALLLYYCDASGTVAS